MDVGDMKRWATVRPGYWFAPKLYGWGATPVTWQGWAVTIGFVALILAVVNALEGPARLIAGLPLTACFILVVLKKTDGAWRWRWGDTDRR